MTPQEEKALVDRIVEREIRLLTLAEEHADVVRRQGPDVLKKAYDEAAATPLFGPERGEDMEAYYKRHEPLLTANATTNVQHMQISLVAMGLLHAQTLCEYTRLTWDSQLEAGRRTTKHMRQLYNPNGPAQPEFDYLQTERLPVLPTSTPRNNTQCKKLSYQRVAELLQNFSKLHFKELIEEETGEFYRVVGINYSQMEAGKVDSYEVQLEGCQSAITFSSKELEDMLRGSLETI